MKACSSILDNRQEIEPKFKLYPLDESVPNPLETGLQVASIGNTSKTVKTENPKNIHLITLFPVALNMPSITIVGIKHNIKRIIAGLKIGEFETAEFLLAIKYRVTDAIKVKIPAINVSLGFKRLNTIISIALIKISMAGRSSNELKQSIAAIAASAITPSKRALKAGFACSVEPQSQFCEVFLRVLIMAIIIMAITALKL